LESSGNRADREYEGEALDQGAREQGDEDHHERHREGAPARHPVANVRRQMNRAKPTVSTTGPERSRRRRSARSAR
jgi:hypothetical protein